MTNGTGSQKRPPRTNALKIDKDCFVDPRLNAKYIRTVLDTCDKYGITVQSIKCSKSKHGIHFYIKIKPPVTAETANNLQYLLGDDSKRVEFNRARIESNLTEWNKLFETPNVEMKTIYRSRATRIGGTDVAVQTFRLIS